LIVLVGMIWMAVNNTCQRLNFDHNDPSAASRSLST